MTDREQVNRIIREALSLAEKVDRLDDCAAWCPDSTPVRRQVQLAKGCLVDAVRAYQEARKCEWCETRKPDAGGSLCTECWNEVAENNPALAAAIAERERCGVR